MATLDTLPFVDGMSVLLAIGRQAVADGDLPAGLSIFSKIQDNQADYLPTLVITRTGGSSDRPEFVSDFFCHFTVWSDRDVDYPNDPFGAAKALARKVATVYYRAWQQQTLALDADGHVLGWINQWRESSGFQDFTDPDLPHIGRYEAVYDLKIRNRRPKSV